MLRFTNYGLKLIDQRLFGDEGKLWDPKLQMPQKIQQDFGLEDEKRCYVDYISDSAPILFIMPRQCTNKAQNKTPNWPDVSDQDYLSDRQKQVYNHIQKDTLELDSFELELVLLRHDYKEPIVARRILADGDPAHLSLR